MKIIPSVAGLPDRCVFLGQGRAVFVELKQTHGKLSKIQKCIHSRLQIRGYRVYTLFGPDDIDWFADEELPGLLTDYWPGPDFKPAPAREGAAGVKSYEV